VSEFGLYCAIKKCEAAARAYDEAGKHGLAAASRKQQAEYSAELGRRLRGLLASGKTLQVQLRRALPEVA